MSYNKNIHNPDLDIYRKLAGSIPDKKVPGDLKELTWKRIGNNLNTEPARFSINPIYYIGIGIAAMLMLAVILFVPATVETDYYRIAEKKGKGPTEDIEYSKGQDPRVDRIIEYCDGMDVDIVAIDYVEDSPMVASIAFKIARDDYPIFREAYNKHSAAGMLPESVSSLKAGRIRVQVYFPGRKYFIGDFNGDGYDDFGSCFIKDRESSLFYISLNNTSGGFDKALAFSPGKNLLISRKDEICSGDINGDGLDDLVIKYARVKGQAAEFTAYINNNDFSFTRSPWAFPNIITSPLQKTFCTDFNGDNLDDLAFYNYRGAMSGKFFVALNKDSKEFAEPIQLHSGLSIPDSTIKHKALVMDINGDGLTDTGIYWQMGEKNAYWYFSLTVKDLIGAPELGLRFGRGHMAFMGDYLVYTGDTNNDGYDELLVKAGTTDEVSFWYHMINEKEGNFSSTGAIDFNGQEDIIVR